LHYGPSERFPQWFFRTRVYGWKVTEARNAGDSRIPGVWGDPAGLILERSMKLTSICVAAALAVLWAGSVVSAAQTTTQKPTASSAKPAAKETTKPTAAQDKKLESLKSAYETDIAPWKDVLKIAQEEKATKTADAIKKYLNTREEAYKKDVARIERTQPITPKTPTSKATEPNKAKTADPNKKPASR
jgi:hypothetical protein